MTYPKRVWDRQQLIDNIWGTDFFGDTKTVDVHIRWLREKIEDDPRACHQLSQMTIAAK